MLKRKPFKWFREPVECNGRSTMLVNQREIVWLRIPGVGLFRIYPKVKVISGLFLAARSSEGLPVCITYDELNDGRVFVGLSFV